MLPFWPKPNVYAACQPISTSEKLATSCSKAMWQHMGTMHGQDYHMQGMFGSGPLDEAEARKSFQAMADTQKAMFEMQLDARKKIDVVLTKEQREKLGRYWSNR